MENVQDLPKYKDPDLDDTDREIISDTRTTFDIPWDPRKWSRENIENWFYWMRHTLRFKFGKIAKDNINLAQSFNEAQNPVLWVNVYGLEAGLELYKKFRQWLKYKDENTATELKLKPIDNNCHRLSKKPQRRNEKKDGLYLWQILLRLLSDSQYMPIISWIDKSRGTFKIKSPNEVARIWGLSKNNSRMSYDKMSRSMRQYYKSDLLKKETHDKLNYCFNMDDHSVKQFLRRCQIQLPPIRTQFMRPAPSVCTTLEQTQRNGSTYSCSSSSTVMAAAGASSNGTMPERLVQLGIPDHTHSDSNAACSVCSNNFENSDNPGTDINSCSDFGSSIDFSLNI